MSSVLHFLFYLAVLSGATGGLSQGGKLSQKEPTSQHSEKKLKKWLWIRLWMAILKP